MKNWRLKRMKDGEIRENIKACNKFLRVYLKGKWMEGSSCLFCKITEAFHPTKIREARCGFCLWKIMEEESCESFSHRELGTLVVGIKHKASWRKLRIPMLRQWIKILKAEVAKREQ